jgi:quercetin dioxygenase-like cupin family protein
LEKTMTSAPKAELTRWDDLPKEAMRGAITRRFVTTERQMLAQITLQKGDVVPAHRHSNEQFTYVLSGSLKFLFGEDQADEKIVSAGEVVVIRPTCCTAPSRSKTHSSSIYSRRREPIGSMAATRTCAPEEANSPATLKTGGDALSDRRA